MPTHSSLHIVMGIGGKGMKYRLAIILFTLDLGVLPSLGAMASQFDGQVLNNLLDEVEITETELNWEQIPDLPEITQELPKLQEATAKIEEIVHTRHEEVKTHWWEIDGEIPDNPNVPNDIEFWCVVIGAIYNICPELLMAIIETESRFDPEAKNGQYTGLCQVGTKVHKGRIEKLGYTVEQMTEIEPNIHVAADYLAELAEKYDGDMAAALLAYNGHTKGLQNYFKTGHVAYYARHILERSAELERENKK